MPIRVANAPCSWGVDYADAPDNPPAEAVFAGIGAAGYRATELGPYGYAPTQPAELTSLLGRHGLTLIAGFLFELLHDPRAHATIEAKATDLLGLLKASGGTRLVLIDHISPSRERTAGRSDVAARLDTGRFDLMAALCAHLSRRAAAEGITAVLHHHAASHVEFADEVERFLDAVPSLKLCIDTGHAAFAGIDPVALVDRWGERIGHIHLKDIDPKVRDDAVADACGFDEAVSRGVFVPLGRGVVDFAAFAEA
ncbi:MAG: TIM barrel protein, partial [Pseudomonadota bacterium]